MLSGKFVHLVESHWDQIMARVINQVSHDPEMTHFPKLVEAEWREWGQDLLQNLNHWLAGGHEKELACKYEEHGQRRFDEDVPLEESVRCLCVMRHKVIDYVDEHIITKNAMELYAEEELLRRLARFFDMLLLHMVRGYERSMRRSLALTTSAH
jgi:hypothetical protein